MYSCCSVKKLFIILFFLIVSIGSSYAQKYACVNTEYILKNMPDYEQALQRLDKYVSDWQREIEDKMQQLETLRQSYQQESYLLPDNLKARRQQEIKTRDQEIHDLQRQRFSSGGDLDKKRSELLKPIQDRIYNVIEKLAQEKGYAFVFDRAASATLLFASEKYDLSDQVLESLGYKNSATQEQESNDSNKNDKRSKSQKGKTNPEMMRP